MQPIVRTAKARIKGFGSCESCKSFYKKKLKQTHTRTHTDPDFLPSQRDRQNNIQLMSIIICYLNFLKNISVGVLGPPFGLMNKNLK